MGKALILKGVNYEPNMVKKIPIIDYSSLDEDVQNYTSVVTISDNAKMSLNYLIKNLRII